MRSVPRPYSDPDGIGDGRGRLINGESRREMRAFF